MDPFILVTRVQSCWDWHGEHAFLHNFSTVRSRQPGRSLLALLTYSSVFLSVCTEGTFLPACFVTVVKNLRPAD